jgi:hypothetical protein
MFKAYVLGSAVHIPEYKTWKAMIRGRYDIYVPQNSKFVHNVFELNAELETSPLLGLRILQTLKDAVISEGDTKSRFMLKADWLTYMTAMNLERRAVLLWLDALLKKALVLNYDPTIIDAENATKLEISPSGEQHLYWGRGNYEYLLAMAEATSLADPAAFNALELANRSLGSRRFQDVIDIFTEYLWREDRLFCRVPDHESYKGQHELFFRSYS